MMMMKRVCCFISFDFIYIIYSSIFIFFVVTQYIDDSETVKRFKLRKLLEDTEDSEESPDGVDSDDSKEVNVANAFFTIAESATDGEGNVVNVTLGYGSSHEVHVVFDYFVNSVWLDPHAGVAITDSGVACTAKHVLSLLFSVVCLAFALN